MEVLHINGSRAVLLLFCDHQENDYESCETEMSIYQPKTDKALWDNDIHTVQYVRKVLC